MLVCTLRDVVEGAARHHEHLYWYKPKGAPAQAYLVASSRARPHTWHLSATRPPHAKFKRPHADPSQSAKILDYRSFVTHCVGWTVRPREHLASMARAAAGMHLHEPSGQRSLQFKRTFVGG